MLNVPGYLVLYILLGATPAYSEETQGTSAPTPQRKAEIIAYYDAAASNWEPLPEQLLLAFVAGEDRLFFENEVHRSTITNKVAKRLITSTDTPAMMESQYTRAIGSTLSHDQVLNWYANGVYLGLSCFGPSDSAAAYFGKELEQVDLGEAAFLAAVVAAPSYFNPEEHLDRAVDRRNFVLSEMERAGFIGKPEMEAHINSDLTVLEPLMRCRPRAEEIPRWKY